MAKRAAKTKKSDEQELFPAAEEAPPSGPVRTMFKLPARFKAFSEPATGFVVVQDLETGNDVQVAVSAWGEVRRTLGALFGGEAESTSSFVPEEVLPGAPEKSVAAALDLAADPSIVAQPVSGNTPKKAEQKVMPEVKVEPTPAAPKAATAKVTKAPAKPKASKPKADSKKAKPAPEAPVAEQTPVAAVEAAPSSNGPALPPGFEQHYDGQGYVLDLTTDPKTGDPAYKVVVEGETVGYVRIATPEKLMVYSLNDQFSDSTHRKMFGVLTKLDVRYED